MIRDFKGCKLSSECHHLVYGIMSIIFFQYFFFVPMSDVKIQKVDELSDVIMIILKI
jgi:hypothetical protein